MCSTRTQVNHLRCAEYDAVLRSESEGLVHMPHVGMLDLIRRHLKLLNDDFCAVDDEMKRTDVIEELEMWREIAWEIRTPLKHSRLTHDYLEFLGDLLEDTELPRVADWTPEYAAQYGKGNLEGRIRRYPLAGFIDGGISIAIDDLLDCLKDSISPEDAHAFLQDISCFVSPPQDQEASEQTRMEEPGSTALPFVPPQHHVLHLPVLLVNHQFHECGLDEATRNRQRLNCVSAVQFLASLGIKDFPVYGLATSGQYGYVSSTWFSSVDNVRHLFYA